MTSAAVHSFFNKLSLDSREQLMKPLRFVELKKHTWLDARQPWFIMTGVVGVFDEEAQREVMVLGADSSWLGTNLPSLTRLNVRASGAALTCSWSALNIGLEMNLGVIERMVVAERARVAYEAYQSLAYSVLENVRVEHRVGRYLLQFNDYHLDLTQISIAHAVGVRREGVTAAMARLQQLGLIVHQRSCIDIIDLKGLRAFVHSVNPTKGALDGYSQDRG